MKSILCSFLFFTLVVFDSTVSSSSPIFNLRPESGKTSHQEISDPNAYYHADKEMCTTIAVGKGGMADGSTVVTHNNDCQDCDLRITKVPPRDWPEGSMRPIYGIRFAYPRIVQAPENDTYGPDYVMSKTYPDSSLYKWNASVPIAFIEQVPHTYGYVLGAYGIQNEKQVSIGESTCSAMLVAKPVTLGGKAKLHMQALTELALERCDTARCAIEVMGNLSETHGYFGDQSTNPDINQGREEAGEALSVADPNEAWVFHILPDDTGASSVWVAQRVPDGHIATVTNTFIIGEVDLNNPDQFMASSNLIDVAVRTGLWSPDSNEPFHFTKVYSTDRLKLGYMSTRRRWRIFTLAAPSLKISPFTDSFGSFGFGEDGTEPYPFSVPVDQPLHLQDIMTMNRDLYQGTPFDLTKGPSAGPYGDPTRFAFMSSYVDSVNGMTYDQFTQGLNFERAISLFRTTYSSIAQSRSNLPDYIGALTWFAMNAPHHSSFIPVYASASRTPSSLNRGTQYKMDRGSNWWVHCLTTNYLSRWYSFATLEDIMFKQQKQVEKKALEMVYPNSSTYADVSEESEVVNRLSNDAIQPIEAAPLRRDISPHDYQIDMEISTSDNMHRILSVEVDTSAIATDFESDHPITFAATRTHEKRKAHAIEFLQAYHEQNALDMLNSWWDFFFKMTGVYRDLYKVVSTHVSEFSMAYRYIGVQRWWFEQVGFFGPPGTPAPGEAQSPILPITYPTQETTEDYAKAYPEGYAKPYPWYSPSAYELLESEYKQSTSHHYSSWIIVSLLIGVLLGVAIMKIWDMKFNNHNKYATLE